MTDKKRKIAVLGTGNVGATTAFTLMHQGVASEIVLVDINKEKAEGEALDLAQCALCAPACKVWMGEYEDCADCDCQADCPCAEVDDDEVEVEIEEAPVAEEAPVEEAPAEEVVIEEGEPVADEEDFAE